jgi:transcriptional regulator with XRE-family HTH domain
MEGQTIRSQRLALGVTTTELSRRAHVPRSSLSLIENGATERRRIMDALAAIKAERATREHEPA